jgi:hypothetical protein
MPWRRLLTAWLCLWTTLIAATTASAAAGAPTKPHQGTADFSAALSIRLHADATVERHTGNAEASTAGAPNVPHAARALPRSGPIPRSLGAASRAEMIAKKVGLNIKSPTSRQVLNSLDDDVVNFIGKFRKGSIKEVFPSEFLKPGVTVEQALLEGGSTVRKLLTNTRFIK